MKYAYLENTQPGHNKFYSMQENPGAQAFTATYGKIGAKVGKTIIYPIHEWNTKYSEKISKGYVDKTNYSRRQKLSSLTPNQAHVMKLETVLNILTSHKENISGSAEMIRYTTAVLKSLRSAKTLEQTNISRDDMIQLNDIWSKIKNYA